MKIRTTERPHVFSDRVFHDLGAHGLQGLTLDSKNNFTAGIEAAEFEPGENTDVLSLFSEDDWRAKWALCKSLELPLFTLRYTRNDSFIEIFQIVLDAGLGSKFLAKLSFEEFCKWWRSLKGTTQSKPLYEAESRISFFDSILEKCGLAWGGNIDEFLLDSSLRPRVLFETRYTTRSQLDKYDPADFFRGSSYKIGDYKTWEPLVLLAMQLKIPLFLVTFERWSSAERLGFSVVDSLSEDGIFYRYGRPCDNIIQGSDSFSKKNRSKSV